MTKRTATFIKAAVYWVGFAALTAGTVHFAPAIITWSGIPRPFGAFLWVNIAAAYSWSLGRWMMDGKHW